MLRRFFSFVNTPSRPGCLLSYFFIVRLRRDLAADSSRTVGKRSVCSWLTSVSGSESGSGSIPTVYRFRRRMVVGPHAWCSLVTLETRFLVSKPHLLSFDSDSDTDPDPDYKPLGFGHFFIVRLRRDLAAAWSRFLAIRLLLVPIGVGVGIGIGIDSDDVSIPPAYGGWSSRMV
jgi:hypothetical protein